MNGETLLNDGGCTCRFVRYRDIETPLRALLPLPMVPARSWKRIRTECADRSRSRALAAGPGRNHRHAIEQRQGPKDLPLPTVLHRGLE